MKTYMKIISVIGSIMILWLFFTYRGCDQSNEKNKAVVENNIVYQCPMHPAYTLDKPGDCAICGMKLVKKERKLLYYRNPMNPESTSPVPMKDSMGMDYIPVYEETGQSAIKGVVISPEKQQMIGVKTGRVMIMNLAKDVRVSGRIAYDPDLVVAQEEFIQALNSGFADSDRSMLDAGRNKLKLLGMSEDQIISIEKSRKSETNLYLPAKGESVWAYINVYEYEIEFIKIGERVEIEAVAYPGEKFSGKIVSVNPVLDAQTRSNQVRVAVQNPENKLKPEMYVNAKIKNNLGPKLAVPESAILDTGLRKIVYLLRENNAFESREVTLGAKAGNYYEVKGGLYEGDTVVTSGNFLVDSESKLKSHSHGN